LEVNPVPKDNALQIGFIQFICDCAECFSQFRLVSVCVIQDFGQAAFVQGSDIIPWSRIKFKIEGYIHVAFVIAEIDCEPFRDGDFESFGGGFTNVVLEFLVYFVPCDFLGDALLEFIGEILPIIQGVERPVRQVDAQEFLVDPPFHIQFHF